MEMLRRPEVLPHTVIKHENHGGSPNPTGSQTYDESLVKAIIKEVVNQRVETDDFRPFFKQNAMPLIAAAEESLEVARCLLEARANHNHRNTWASTPLGTAVLVGSLETAKLLVECGGHQQGRRGQ